MRAPVYFIMFASLSLPLGPEPAAERGQVRRHHHPHPRVAQRLAGEEEREAEAS